MLNTPILDPLRIRHPIIQAGMGRFGSGARLAAAVSDAGAIGTIGGAKRSVDDLGAELSDIRELTEAGFIVNFTQPWLRLHPECLDIALASRPRAISISAGLPGDLAPRVHDHGALLIAQVQTVEQARVAADEGADIVIAQGAEAGGYGARLGDGGVRIGSLALIPQVVDAIAPLPVVAAGGIVDGRGLAAVLLLGASGANIGTRFLATVEASIADEWKQRLVAVGSDETLHLPLHATVEPTTGSDTDRAVAPVTFVVGATDVELPASGQGAGVIRSIRTAADVVEQLVRDAEECLAQAHRTLLAGALVQAGPDAGPDAGGPLWADG